MSVRDDTWVPVESGSPVRICSLQVNELCGQKAVEILHVRRTPGEPWEEFPRCREHPARDWLPMISRIYPHSETRIEPIRETS